MSASGWQIQRVGMGKSVLQPRTDPRPHNTQPFILLSEIPHFTKHKALYVITPNITKGKGIPVHAMKSHIKRGEAELHSFLTTALNGVVNTRTGPPYPPWYTLNTRLDGSQDPY